jgi:hypothetical protein
VRAARWKGRAKPGSAPPLWIFTAASAAPPGPARPFPTRPGPAPNPAARRPHLERGDQLLARGAVDVNGGGALVHVARIALGGGGGEGGSVSAGRGFWVAAGGGAAKGVLTRVKAARLAAPFPSCLRQHPPHLCPQLPHRHLGQHQRHAGLVDGALADADGHAVDRAGTGGGGWVEGRRGSRRRLGARGARRAGGVHPSRGRRSARPAK